MNRSYAFTLAEGRQAWQTKSALTHQASAKGGQVQDIKRETIQLIKKTGLEKQNAGLTHVTNLFPYSSISLFPCKRTAFTLAEGRLACTTTQAPAKVAFTLAEVLITLAIIGVVAVLTLPNLIQNHNQKAWSTAQDVFTKRLEVATRQMNTEEKLAGYDSTMDFVNELKKYIKITRVCDNNELTKCFNSNILTADGQNIDMSEFESDGKQFTKDNWGTETVGVQFANGVNALVAYNPNTDQQPFNNQFSATEASMAILYDVSGYKNPNTLGKDVNQNANVKTLGCMIEPDYVGGMCITKILTNYNSMTSEECETQKGNLGIEACYWDTDYWAGAVKACGGTRNMPTEAQLIALAKYLYNTDSIDGGYTTTDAALDEIKAEPFMQASSVTGSFNIWAREVQNEYFAYTRYFGITGTSYSNYGRRYGDSVLAVCLDN